MKYDKKYYIEGRNYDSKTERSTTFIITPEIKEKYIKYNSGLKFYFNREFIHEPDVLFQHMQKDGSITKEKIISHKDFHLQNEIRRFNEETMRRLNAIFLDEQFIISYEINPDFEYPNKSNYINNFIKIENITVIYI